MLDTLTLARELKDSGIEPRQADAITHVVQQAVEQADPATREDLNAHRGEARADLYTHRAEVRETSTRTAPTSEQASTRLRADVRADIAALEARLTDAMLHDSDPADWLNWRRTLDGP